MMTEQEILLHATRHANYMHHIDVVDHRDIPYSEQLKKAIEKVRAIGECIGTFFVKDSDEWYIAGSYVTGCERTYLEDGIVLKDVGHVYDLDSKDHFYQGWYGLIPKELIEQAPEAVKKRYEQGC